MSDDKQSREGLILRVLWMVLFAIVWQLAELVLVAVVLLQLVLRLINGAPSRALMDFGDGLSQYLAQIGRFGCFHSDEKPWPFADWPAPREAQGEGARPLTPAPAVVPAAAASAAVAPVAASAPAEAPVAESAAEAAETPSGTDQAAPAPEAGKADGPDAPAEPRA